MTIERVALVTGASRGVGKRIALALGDEGYAVYVSGRSSVLPTDPVGGTTEATADEVTSRGGYRRGRSLRSYERRSGRHHV